MLQEVRHFIPSLKNYSIKKVEENVTKTKRTSFKSISALIVIVLFFSKYENICFNLERFEQRRRCPKRLRHLDIQCYCPFRAGAFSVKNLAVNIPKIGGYAGSFVKVRVSILLDLLFYNIWISIANDFENWLKYHFRIWFIPWKCLITKLRRNFQ